jgi:hypothetical protein
MTDTRPVRRNALFSVLYRKYTFLFLLILQFLSIILSSNTYVFSLSECTQQCTVFPDCPLTEQPVFMAECLLCSALFVSSDQYA